MLENGTRVLSQRGTVRSLGLNHAAQLGKFVSTNALKTLINEDVSMLAKTPIIFKLPNIGLC